jgi:PEP-CTERM motif-containing protein
MARFVRLFPLVFLFLSSSTTARAEPFTVLPNGDLVFDASISTNGLFTCGTVVACTGSGTNSITLTSGGGTATFLFTAVSTSFVVGNSTIPVTVGTFTDSTTPGFLLPDNININTHLFSIDVTLSQSSPAVGLDRVNWGFNRTFTRFGEGMRTYFQLPIGSQPPQYHYTSIIYSLRADEFTLPTNGSKDLVADTGVVPEPTSLVLAGTGLVGALYRRRKRNLRS